MKRVWRPISQWKLNLQSYEKTLLWNDLLLLLLLLILCYLAYFVPLWIFALFLTPANSIRPFSVLIHQSYAKVLLVLLLGFAIGRISVIWLIYKILWLKVKWMPTRLEMLDRE